MLNTRELLEKRIIYLTGQIEHNIKVTLANENEHFADLYQIFYHHLGFRDALGKGKMVRPVFLLLACEALNGDLEKAIVAAVAVELLHNFTLIHDDIQDESCYRRGRETIWKVWGRAQAINAGDILFTIAHNKLLELANKGDAQTTLRIISLFDRACLELGKGQFFDMSFEKRNDIDVATYLEMARLKAASLWRACGHIGALLATTDKKQVASFRDLGEALGVVFQIRDDVLGIWGDARVTGKSNRDDLRKWKKSLPIVYALSKKDTSPEFYSLYCQESKTEDEISRMVHLMEQMGCKSYCEEIENHYRKKIHQIFCGKKYPLLDHFVNLLIERQH